MRCAVCRRRIIITRSCSKLDPLQALESIVAARPSSVVKPMAAEEDDAEAGSDKEPTP